MNPVSQEEYDACAYNNAYMIKFIKWAPKRFQNRLLLAMVKDDFDGFDNLMIRGEVKDNMDEGYYGHLCNEAKSKWGVRPGR